MAYQAGIIWGLKCWSSIFCEAIRIFHPIHAKYAGSMCFKLFKIKFFNWLAEETIMAEWELNIVSHMMKYNKEAPDEAAEEAGHGRVETEGKWRRNHFVVRAPWLIYHLKTIGGLIWLKLKESIEWKQEAEGVQAQRAGLIVRVILGQSSEILDSY